GHVWSHQLTHAGASFVALHFQGFDLPPGAHLRVTDGSGEQGYELRGRGKMQAGTFWSQHVRGDTIRLELFTPVHETPFVIDRYTAGQPAGFGDRAICGVDDKRGAACYRDSHPEEYANARAVARLLTNGRGFCTGWLVGPDNLLLTNNHCIGTAESAMNTDYEFMAEDNECNVAGAGPSQIFSGGELLATSVPLDYALIRVNGNPSDEFGYLNVDDRVARIGEPIYIAGHPGGRLKELTIESTHPQDRGEIPRVFSVDEPPCTGGDSTDVGYFGDTEGGNSGSPVISAETHGVIALHHCANCPNRGVPIHRVLDEIEDFLISSQGKLDLNRETLACNGSFDMILRDLDLAEEVTQSVTVTTDAGDFETVELASIGGGAFRGSMSLNDSTANPGDLQVQAGHGDLVVVRYTDADDGSGSEAVAQDALFVDCIAPVMSSVAADALAFGAIVRADTDEEASATVRFGTSCEDLSSIVSGAVTITHQVTLEDLDPSTRYFFALEA
ncbi:MAG: trypsin-like peptidase domain-containing protein, partial [Myxococcota bacterium]